MSDSEFGALALWKRYPGLDALANDKDVGEATKRRDEMQVNGKTGYLRVRCRSCRC
jgi:hypothetical protein